MLVTASGAPGTAALLHALRDNGEREVRLVGTDMSERSVGRHLCDAFHLVPAGSDPSFPDTMLEVATRESVDAILPQSSFDLEGLAGHVDRFPMPVLVSPVDAIQRSNDKALTYELMHRLGVPAPAFFRVDGAAGVERAAHELGYPDRPVCFKPVCSRPARAASASSTRPSTARTSSCTSGRERWQCGSKRRSSCCPKAASTCS